MAYHTFPCARGQGDPKRCFCYQRMPHLHNRKNGREQWGERLVGVVPCGPLIRHFGPPSPRWGEDRSRPLALGSANSTSRRARRCYDFASPLGGEGAGRQMRGLRGAMPMIPQSNNFRCGNHSRALPCRFSPLWSRNFRRNRKSYGR
ncbi:hypothetical protein E0H54_23295 [Rhizobium leguminosarum bv. viciae]|nr:hypothetical protein E0H54_23295 [Rhizobium leguminosarum bv. viciae]